LRIKVRDQVSGTAPSGGDTCIGSRSVAAKGKNASGKVLVEHCLSSGLECVASFACREQQDPMQISAWVMLVV